MPLKINNKILPESEIINEMKKMRDKHVELYPDLNKSEREKLLFEWAVENLHEREILLEYAEKNMTIKPEELEKETKKFEKELSDTEAKNIKSRLKLNKLLNSFRDKFENLPEKEMKKYYKTNINKFRSPEQIYVKHIVIKENNQNNAYETMKQIKKELESEDSFEKIGNKYSDCSGSGLDLGYFARGTMVQSFEDVVFKMGIGEISDIFETEFGFHIAKLYDKRPEITAPFQQVKEQIKINIITEKSTKEIQKLVDKLKPGSKPEYELPDKIFESAQKGFLFKKSLGFILVKPTGALCNLACDYCFYLDKSYHAQIHLMQDDVLEEMIKQAAEQSDGRFNFGWQGGEPTLMGLDFFRKVISLQAKYGGRQKFGNSLQTNGILLDEEWAKFLKDNQFLVGLSIDGDQHIHDKYRKDKHEKGSWEKVKSVAEMLLSEGVLVNSLSTVNNYSVNYPEETYRFLKNIGFSYMQFIPIVEFDETHKDFSVDVEKYGKFLCKIFDLWQSDFQQGQPTTSIRMFDSLLHRYLGMEAPECNMREECGIYLVAEHNGDIYSCDFYVEPEWKLGNLMKNNILEMLNSEKQERFGNNKQNLNNICLACEWLNLCHGGCTKDRFHNQNVLCEAYKIFFEYSEPIFKKLVKEFQ